MDQIYSSLAALESSGKNAVLCIVTASAGSTPRKASSKMLVIGDGSTNGSVGGGKIELMVIEEARKMLGTNQTKTISYDLTGDLDMQCGGKMTIYFETINSSSRLLIFGAGHIGKVLAAMAVKYGFKVILIDNREEVFKEKINGVEFIHQEFPIAYESMEFFSNDFVVVTTYKHTYDEEITAYILGQPHAYLGMMASKRKAAVARKKWDERGIEQEKIEKVFSPIGVSIQCETPDEIALSVMAQLVDQLNKTRNS